MPPLQFRRRTLTPCAVCLAAWRHYVGFPLTHTSLRFDKRLCLSRHTPPLAPPQSQALSKGMPEQPILFRTMRMRKSHVPVRLQPSNRGCRATWSAPKHNPPSMLSSQPPSSLPIMASLCLPAPSPPPPWASCSWAPRTKLRPMLQTTARTARSHPLTRASSHGLSHPGSPTLRARTLQHR